MIGIAVAGGACVQVPVPQLPESLEGTALSLVQFNNDPPAVLAERLSTALGAVMPAASVGLWLHSVAQWQVLDGPGGAMPGVWRVVPQLVAKYKLPSELPAHVVRNRRKEE